MARIPLADTEAVFAALANESRRNILVLLSHLGGELPSGYLAARFQHSWPTTTRHLGVLEKAGLVEVRREGRSAFYRLNRDRVRGIVEAWLGHLEPTGPEKTWTSSGPKSTGGLRRSGSQGKVRREP
ncbi:metalloregulator ArsR/SmtB family transcription factor [Pendulispora brunnea]|uniref:Metalloregulator ArsR/SmtB family transcription factor n=1 Tax=Pendulispora brunnea TaxID=2905690 RepID=A0ABZ2JU98_9BACT